MCSNALTHAEFPWLEGGHFTGIVPNQLPSLLVVPKTMGNSAISCPVAPLSQVQPGWPVLEGNQALRRRFRQRVVPGHERPS